MKKLLLFIFTFIVGISAYADSYLYIDDFPVYRNQLGTEIVVPVKAHFDARVSSVQVYLNCPEGLDLQTVEAGADLFISYLDNNGITCTVEPFFSFNSNVIIAVSTISVMGYWIPEGSTNYESYGAVKWESGDYDEFFLLRFSVADNFNGGSITLETTCSSAYDTRGGTVNDNGDAQVPFTKVCNVSVTDDPVVEKTPSPFIDYTITTDDVTITASGEGIVSLFVNGDEVNNPYVINRIFEDQTLSVFSYAQEIGKLISDTVYLTIIVPAKEGQPDKTDSPTISYSTTDDDVIITATGNGNVLLYIDGLIVDNPHSISRAETDFYVTATATAQEEGKLISETTIMQIFIPAREDNPNGKEYKIEKVWELNDLSFLNKNDARQGFGMGGKFYINDKGTKTVYVVDQNGLTGTTYPGGANCGITRDEVGNIIVSDAEFPNAWGENATIKVINPQSNQVKEYIVPTDCGLDGRCDFLGFAYGNMMDGVGELFLAGATTSGIASLMTYHGNIVGYYDDWYTDFYSLTPSSSTVINHYRDLDDNSCLLYVTRISQPVKIGPLGQKRDVSEEGSIALVDKGSINGVFPFVWGDKELFLYPTTPNYYDGFAIAEAGVEPIVKVPATTTTANGYQCNWLNAEVNDDGSVSIYQYYPGGHITMYRLTDNSTPVSEKTATPEITYEITDEAVVITATGEGNVILYVDGLMVDNPYSVIRTETDYYVTATATAQEEGKLISEIASLRINVPANENPLDENDWNILKSFYNQYSNGHFTWDLSDAVIAKKCEGVTVENLRVVAIDLSSKSLEGDFPAMLLALDQLRTLDLSNNNLSGDAEYQIAEFASSHNISTDALHCLLINDNEFVGNAGSLASYFNNLEVLRAGGNHFNQVQPMVNPDVELDLNNQSLDMDGNIINGIETLSSALPSICLYDHNRQTFMTTVNLELIDVTQNPEWKMNIYMGNGEFSISSNSAYRGSNGQHLDGHTYLQSSWNNEQKLNLLFTFAPGDANFKGNVDITDLQAIVNYIFGDNNNKPFNYTAANLNNDNIVNVQDVVGEVNMLLSTIPSTPRYYTRYVPDTDSIDDNAQLYWEQGVLYLRTNKPVAAIDIVNEVNGDIEWNVANIGMVIMTSMCEKGEHAIIYSLDNAAFQPGVTAIATTTATVQSIYAAKLSDTDAELVSVTLNTNPAELNDITIDSEVSCRLEGTCLVINNGKNLSEVDIDVYAIDGMLVANKHMPLLNSGANRVNLIELIENNQLYIIVVRNGRQVIATQKITQIR